MTPIQVEDSRDPGGFLTGIESIRAGWDFTLALKGDGTVWGWGYNFEGQIGTGVNFNFYTEPEQTLDPNDPSGNLTGVLAIEAGGSSSAALR